MQSSISSGLVSFAPAAGGLALLPYANVDHILLALSLLSIAGTIIIAVTSISRFIVKALYRV